MNQKTLELMQCPRCSGLLENSSNIISCKNCQTTFPIVDEIPRFVSSENYVGSFGFEWNKFDVVIPEEDDQVFRVKTGWTPEMLKGKLVLDAGCGGGRYSRVAASWGAKVVSLDMSKAVEKAKEINKSNDVTIIQTDLHNPPIKPESFDFVFSIGVLHHSSDTKKAFDTIAKLVKPGGQLAVWLYRKNTWPQELLNSTLRAITTRLPDKLLLGLCYIPAFLAGIPVLNVILGRIVNLGVTHPKWEIRLCDAYDWYSPKYQYHHTLEEMDSWYKQAGFPDSTVLKPQKRGNFYLWVYDHNLIIGSGVNRVGTKKQTSL